MTSTKNEVILISKGFMATFHFMEHWRPPTSPDADDSGRYEELAAMGRKFPVPPSSSRFGGLPDSVADELRLLSGEQGTVTIEVVATAAGATAIGGAVGKQ